MQGTLRETILRLGSGKVVLGGREEDSTDGAQQTEKWSEGKVNLTDGTAQVLHVSTGEANSRRGVGVRSKGIGKRLEERRGVRERVQGDNGGGGGCKLTAIMSAGGQLYAYSTKPMKISRSD